MCLLEKERSGYWAVRWAEMVPVNFSLRYASDSMSSCTENMHGHFPMEINSLTSGFIEVFMCKQSFQEIQQLIFPM